MTSIGTPNWFTVTSAFFALSGILLLAKALLIDTSTGDEVRQKLAKGERLVDLRLALPLLVIGAVLNLFGQMAVLSFGPVATSMSLALVGVLILYAMGRELLIEKMVGETSQVRQKPKLAVLPPVAERRDAEARVVERSVQN